MIDKTVDITSMDESQLSVLRELVDKVYREAASTNERAGRLVSAAPTTFTFNGDIAWYSSGGTRRLYMCDGTDWKYVAIST